MLQTRNKFLPCGRFAMVDASIWQQLLNINYIN